MLLSGDEFSELFDNYRQSAWRFETQPAYAIPRETGSFAKFLAGEEKPADHNEPWHKRVRSFKVNGKTIGRVRTLRYPLTDYQRYQLAWGIPGNVQAGEDIRLLDLTGTATSLPDQDFWIFDDITVAVLNFYQDGSLRDRELVESDIDQYLKWRDQALTGAVPFGDYRT